MISRWAASGVLRRRRADGSSSRTGTQRTLSGRQGWWCPHRYTPPRVASSTAEQGTSVNMERQTGDGWYVGGYLLGPPESLRYRSVIILRIGRSAGNPFAESPQRPYAARPNARRPRRRPEGEEMVQTATRRQLRRGRGNPVRQVNPEVLGSNPRRPTGRAYPALRLAGPHGLEAYDACLSRRRSRVRIPLGV